MIKKDKPDNVVFSAEQGYNAKLLPYPTIVSAPVIKTDDLSGW